ncbi:MAG: hypothetical protein K8R40_00135, partial [Anaerolineaceae bacterium]|nr:hypothetical protein [Anaerolineaceae bacterium]
MKKMFGSLNSKLFGKIFFSFMLILFVWMAVFYIGNQIIMNRAFLIYYNRLADNPPPALRQELEERGWQASGESSGPPGEKLDQNVDRQRLFGAKLLEAVQKLFRQASKTAIRWAAMIAFVIAIIASLIMASSLVQPAQAMSVAAQRIAD